MDWFERITGFREADYAETRSKLTIEGSRLHSRVNGASYEVGVLELVSLQALREQAKSAGRMPGRLKMSLVIGNVRRMHALPDNAGALFQVASQFNLLEMVSPDVTPEHGVTRYQSDHTQGPACAIAAGPATIYRNYFAPVGNGQGQTAKSQLDGLADVGASLSSALSIPVGKLWKMQNGYALCTEFGLDAIARHLQTLSLEQLDILRGELCIGLHRDVEVTEFPGPGRPLVSQAFCSALPVAYSQVPPSCWAPFASLILEAAYEATMWATLMNAQRGASNVVFLTLLGGSAFGNDANWIYAAIRRALAMVVGYDIDVRFVSSKAPTKELLALVEEFA